MKDEMEKCPIRSRLYLCGGLLISGVLTLFMLYHGVSKAVESGRTWQQEVMRRLDTIERKIDELIEKN